MVGDQSDRAVFHFGSWQALGVDVTDFFKFQGTFQSDGVVESAAQEQPVVFINIRLSDLPDLFILGQDAFHFFRDFRQFL